MLSEVKKNLLNLSNLKSEQLKAVDFITGNPTGVIIAPTGVGKTIISLSAIAKLKGKWIVAAPPQVCKGWKPESKKWEHTKHLNIVHLVGNPEQRLSLLNTKADVYMISLNSLDWLLQQPHDCTNIILDELSKCAGKQTAKLKTLKCKSLTRRYGLTATPVAESFEKLFAMVRILDNGAALGRNKQSYLNKYFYPTDYKQYNWKLSPGSAGFILDKIEHLICDVKIDKNVGLPPISYDDIVFTMPDNTRDVYNTMKSDMLIDGNSAVVATNSAVLSGKLRQISSGFAITEDGEVLEYDTARAETLLSILPDTALIIYEYNHQLTQIERVFNTNNISYLSVFGGSDKDTAVNKFKSGNINYLVAQALTLSHGVDGLQHATADVIFFAPLWSNDGTIQTIGRVHRTGQTKPVTITTIVCDDTLDDMILDRVDDKKISMTDFLQHLRG